jgi:hypothetical protein
MIESYFAVKLDLRIAFDSGQLSCHLFHNAITFYQKLYRMRALSASSSKNLAARTKSLACAWGGEFPLPPSRFSQKAQRIDTSHVAIGRSANGLVCSHRVVRILSEAMAGNSYRFDVASDVLWTPFPDKHMFYVLNSVIGAWYFVFKDRFGI